ncbi:MAG: transposase [Oscillochloris sp.]|nr:transposase [Oscillochloris sp.]
MSITTAPASSAEAIHSRGSGTRHARSRFAVSPVAPQPEPQNLTRVKAEVGQRWPTTSLLDILKEAALRIGFTQRFSSVTAHDALDPATLQKRLLLCLYGLGTNTGLKAVSAGDHGASYCDLKRNMAAVGSITWPKLKQAR